MNQTEFEAMMERLNEIYDRLTVEKHAMQFVITSTDDVNTMSNLTMISYGMQLTQNMLARIVGRPEDLVGLDVPY